MNVKPGDLARIVDSDFSANNGKLVLVLRRADPNDYYRAPTPDEDVEWECELLSPATLAWGDEFRIDICAAGDVNAFGDSGLRPIRPGDLEDESVTDVIKEQTCEHQ